MSMKTIVLTGMSGVGKSSVAKSFATNFGFSFIDIDSLIEEKEKMTISDIFATKGEDYFRDAECGIIKTVPLSNAIVAIGGGAFENNDTRKFLTDNCFVIYLEASVQTILDRLSGADDRPLLRNNLNSDTIIKILSKRLPNYRKAHKIINTDNKTIETVVKEIYDIC